MGKMACPVCGGKMKGHGTTAAGSKRWQCTSCGATATRKLDSVAKGLKAFLDWLLSPSPHSSRPLTVAVLPSRVIAIGNAPPTGDAGLAGQNLVTGVAELVGLLERHRAGADDGQPFRQDEKTRLPAEMFQLDGWVLCFMGSNSHDTCAFWRTSSKVDQRQKTASKLDRKSSHWDIFPMGRFFTNDLHLHKSCYESTGAGFLRLTTLLFLSDKNA